MPQRLPPARRALVMLAVGLALAATGCMPERMGVRVGGRLPVTQGVPERGAGFERFYQQELSWEPCPEDGRFQCAVLTVPLSYIDPAGDTITVTVNRLPALDPQQRIGALVTNPGGPGVSGLEYLFTWYDTLEPLRSRYDLVGFDPRGVGQSTPVRCLDGAGFDAFYGTDFTGSSETAKQQAVEATRRYAAACQANAGWLLPHVGTENVTRDMDVLRAALGDAKLNFLGFSYGTRLGQLYAEQYPERVGRMVLDSIDNPNPVVVGKGAADPLAETEAMLGRIIDDCVTRADCPLGRDRAGAFATLDRLLDQLTTDPLPTSDGRWVNTSVAVTALFDATYSQDYWELLYQALDEALHGNGDGMQYLADDYNFRGEDGQYASAAAFDAVRCLAADPVMHHTVTDAAEYAASVETWAAEAVKVSPHFGAWWVYSDQTCYWWPVAPTFAPEDPITAEGAPPILLVNNTHDAATPLQDAQAVDDTLVSALLVPNHAAGHNAYTAGWPCIDQIVNTYLLSGAMPAEGTSCPLVSRRWRLDQAA